MNHYLHMSCHVHFCLSGQSGCSKYFEHNKELMFYERQNEILRVIEDLEL